MKRLLTIAALLCLLCSCERRTGHYDKGMSLLGSDEQAAVREFMLAVLDGDNAAMAHFQLAMLCDRKPDMAGVTAWHISEYLKNAKGLSAQEVEETEQWLRRTEKRYAISINRRLGENITDEATLRLKLLEEHAMRQKLWIQELTTENVRLRNQLADQQENNSHK
ncbi:MAG: hypothetical protein J5833_03270 [Victivallales bacterium]|nr:hypothetical protein [Victivallales bacterium]